MDTRKRLYRSRNDQMIAGVCGGLAEYLDIDATLIRLAVILLTLMGGAGILAYIIAWIIVPEAPAATQHHHTNKETTMAGHEKRVDGQPTDTKPTPHDAPASKSPSDHKHGASNPHQPRAANDRGRMAAGLVFIAVGFTLYLQLAFDINLWRYSGPIALIVIGLLLIMRRR